MKSLFLFFYLGGIIVTIIVGIWIVLKKGGSEVLFFGSIVHMAILIFLGFLGKSPKFRVYAGERIQTAGYLHTLIGFAVAIGLLGQGAIKLENPDDLSEMLLSIGSALVSSIIGWLFGGELAYKEDDSVEQAIEKIARAFEKIEARQASTLDGRLNELLKFHRGQIKALDERLETLVIRIQQNNQLIIEAFNQLNSNLQQGSNSLGQTFQQFNASIQSISESLIQTFRRLDSVIESESTSLPQSFSRLSSVVEDQSDSLGYSLKQFSSVIEDRANSLSINLKKLEEESQKSSQGMSVTSTSIQHLTEDISKILALIQQLEDLLKYIIEERSKKP